MATVVNASDISLKDLSYVLAVATYGSFTQAAEACAVSQPALSKQIKRFEALLGVSLFERNNRQVLLTEAGKAVVEQARRLLDEAEKLLGLSQSQHLPLSGTFRLGIIASSCPYLLPHWIGPLREAYPSLQLVVTEGLTDGLIHELRQGGLDAVVAATTFEEPSLDYFPLFFEPFCLAYNPSEGYTFGETIAVGEVDPSQLLLLADGHCLKDQTLEVCAMPEGMVANSFKATSLETLLQMTAAGLGISVIPQLAVPLVEKVSRPHMGNKHRPGLSFARFKNQEEGRTMALYYRKTTPFVGDIRLLGDSIQQVLPETVRVLPAVSSPAERHGS